MSATRNCKFFLLPFYRCNIDDIYICCFALPPAPRRVAEFRPFSCGFEIREFEIIHFIDNSRSLFKVALIGSGCVLIRVNSGWTFAIPLESFGGFPTALFSRFRKIRENGVCHFAKPIVRENDVRYFLEDDSHGNTKYFRDIFKNA